MVIDDKFSSENVTVSDESKAFMNNLIEKTYFVLKNIEIISEPPPLLLLASVTNVKQSTLDDSIIIDAGPSNKGTLEKEEKKLTQSQKHCSAMTNVR